MSIYPVNLKIIECILYIDSGKLRPHPFRASELPSPPSSRKLNNMVVQVNKNLFTYFYLQQTIFKAL